MPATQHLLGTNLIGGMVDALTHKACDH